MVIKTICILVFVSFLTHATNATILSSVTAYIQALDDRIIQGGTFINEKSGVRSVGECMVLCAKIANCELSGYLSSAQRCRLHNLLTVDSSDGTNAIGWRYYGFDDPNCPLLEDFYRDDVTNICMHMSPYVMNRTDADIYCSGKQSDVIEILTAEKWDAFYKYVRAKVTSYHVILALYKDTGSWVWSSGIPLTSGINNWDVFRGQPACPMRYHSCHCAYAIGGHDLKWHDNPCSNLARVVCERKDP